MEISDQLRCLYSATVEQRDGSYVVEVPQQEVTHGQIREGQTYRVALLPSPASDESDSEPERSVEATEPDRDQTRGPPEPPVEEGETRNVEIEDLGDQGDGITRVERGFVVIVPDTEPSERVTVKITDVRENVAFAEVTERLSYYD